MVREVGLSGPVAVHDPDVKSSADEGDLVAKGGPRRAYVRRRIEGESCDVRAVSVHLIQLAHGIIALAFEQKLQAVGGPGGVEIDSKREGAPRGRGPIRIGGID